MTSTVRPGHEVVERPLHQQLRFGVELGGRLIQDEQRGVLVKRPSDGNALALAAGEALAAFADDSLIALRHFHDEIVGQRHPRRFHNFRLILGLSTVADVVEDRVVKQDGLLGDHTDLSAQAS